MSGVAQPTIRLRLTLLYAGLFLVAGLLLLGGAYRLIANALPVTPLERRIANLERTEPNSPQLPRWEAQLEERQEALRQVRRQAWRSLLLLTIASGILGWVVAGRALSPISRITDHARRASSENLGERIGLRGPPDELQRLADTFDAMLDRLQSAFETQRLFAGEVSHELRTPLAILRSAADTTLASPDATERERELALTMRATAERSERLIDGLLTLSRAESTMLEMEKVDLAELAGASLEAHARAAGDAGVTIEDGELTPVTVAGDRVLLERLCDNLLDNAIRHNLPRSGWLRLTVRPVDGQAELVVESSGPALDPARLDQFFQPFQRGREAAQAKSGSGLGLAIVRAVVTAHHGTVTSSARPDGGLAVTVRLPVSRSGVTG
jgi:signal transduction histidine kinase